MSGITSFFSSFYHARVHLLHRQTWKNRAIFIVGALIVGAISVVFAYAADWIQEQFDHLASFSTLPTLIITPLGLALSAYLTRRWFKGAQGSGIPQTIAALSTNDAGLRQQVLSLRIAFGKFFLTLIGIASGASVAREGPTVQIGASIMDALGRRFNVRDRSLTRALISAGSAAGIAAAFNTPLAGIVFVIEELNRSFEQKTSSMVFMSVIMAGMVAIGLQGNYNYFGSAAVTSIGGFWVGSKMVLFCGLAGGLAGGLFCWLVLRSAGRLPGAVGRLASERPVVFAAACGLVLSVLGIASQGATFGTGYHYARDVLAGNDVPFSFMWAKLLATWVSFVSGVPGGIFAPSLAVGAGLGGNLTAFFDPSVATAVVVLGMVGYFAGVTQAPLTTVVIVMEMMNNQNLVLPMLLVALIAKGVAVIFNRKPIYHALAEKFLERWQETHPNHKE